MCKPLATEMCKEVDEIFLEGINHIGNIIRRAQLEESTITEERGSAVAVPDAGVLQWRKYGSKKVGGNVRLI